MRKFFRGICGVLATLLTLCILLMAAGLMGVRAFGITPYVVPEDMEGVERANEIKEKAEAARIAADKLQQNVEHFIV